MGVMNSAMRFRGLAVASAVLLALSGVLYWSMHHKPSKKASAASSTPVILNVKPASVVMLGIHPAGKLAVVLSRQSSGNWQILTPRTLPANQQTVHQLLSALSPLKAQRVIETSATDLKPFGLNHPSVEIDVTEKDHAEKKLLFGDNTPTGDSAYVMVAGDPRVFTTYAFHKTDLNKGLDDLRDTRLITANPDKMSRIELTRGGQQIVFDRNSQGNWQIEKPGPYRADAMAVDSLADDLSAARMDLTGTGSSDADADFAQGIPVATVKVTAPAGSQTLEVRQNNGSYYAKSSLANGAYLVDSSIADPLNKKLNSYRNKTVFDFSYNEPNEVDLHFAAGKNGAAQSWYLKRSGENWWLDGKKMDADSVENVISSLRDLTATKFATTGFTKPIIQATVTSKGGSVVERVSIAKSGNEYVAKRANEPTLYVIDGGAIEGLRSAAKSVHPAKKK